MSGAAAVFGADATAGTSVHRPVAEPVPRAQGEEPRPVPGRLRPAFVRAARDSGLPLPMLVAVGEVESNLEDARSAAGARGILQLMPSTAAALQLNVDDPRANVLAGARYLRLMRDRLGSTDLAPAADAAGPTAVAAAGGIPSRGIETSVANVDALRRSLAGCS